MPLCITSTVTPADIGINIVLMVKPGVLTLDIIARDAAVICAVSERVGTDRVNIDR